MTDQEVLESRLWIADGLLRSLPEDFYFQINTDHAQSRFNVRVHADGASRYYRFWLSFDTVRARLPYAREKMAERLLQAFDADAEDVVYGPPD